MFDFTYELEQLDAGDRSPKLIERLIKKHQPRAEEMKKLYERYKTTDVPIFDRKLDDPMKINNQVNNDFFSEIVDKKVGYFAGVPVSYVIPTKGKPNDELQDFIKRNRMADIDAETTKYAAICGYGARWKFIEETLIDGVKKALEKVVNLKPWEVILISENGIDEAKYAVRYITVDLGGKKEMRAELFEPLKSTEYRGESFGNLKEYKQYVHVFDHCPVWGYENNEELQGDAEKVLQAIDAYDRTMSDVNSEIEAFRSAYLAFYGVEPPANEEEEESFAKSGTFYFRDGQKGEFITKVIQDTAVENHLNRLHENIYRFSKTPDTSDESFGGNVTGVALEHKLAPLENKTATFERKFKSASIRMFELLASSFKKRRIQIDPYAIEMKFTRNFPEDILYEADATVKLKGMVSEKTRLSKLSFVEDAEEELKELEKERAAYADTFLNNDTAGGDSDEQMGTARTGNSEAGQQPGEESTPGNTQAV